VLKKYELALWLALYGIVLAVTLFLTKDWNQTEAVAVALTGAIIIWYTWETNLLRSEAQRQIEIQLRPFVVVIPGNKKFRISNIGNGPALNVSIEDVLVDPNLDISIHFPDYISFLSKGETVDVHAESYKRGKPVGDFFNAHLNPSYANQTLLLKIEFQNVEEQRYSVEERVSPEKMQIAGIKGKKLP